jgi:outer membrane protein TolC
MKNGNRNVKVWALGVAMIATTAALSAQSAAPQTPQQSNVQTVVPKQVEKYTVGQAKPPAASDKPLRDMTLEEAEQIALEKNLDLQVAKLNPLIQDYNLASARAAFLPSVNGNFNQQHSSNPSTSTLDGAPTSVVQQTTTYSGGFSQALRWYGGNVGLNFNNTRTSSNQNTSLRNPNFNSSLRVNYTQPILQGFKTDGARTLLKTSVINRQVADIQLQTAIENTKANVRSAYWALRQAIERIEIQQLSLDLSKQQLADDLVKVQIGTMAEIDTAQPETQVASGEQALLAARVAWQQQELAFKRLLASGQDDPLYGVTLNPVDQPLPTQTPVDIPGAIQKALQQRTDIVQQRKQLDITNLNLEVQKNATLPNLSATGSYTLAGAGGFTVARNGDPAIPGGYFDALSQIGTFAQPTWALGANFTYPIGMVNARAALARSQITLQQAQANLKVTELTIATDVTTAGLAVQNTFEQVQAAQKAREAAEKNANAEQTRFSVGLSNPYNVDTALNQLTNARLSELQAVIAYVNAIADYERKQIVGGS